VRERQEVKVRLATEKTASSSLRLQFVDASAMAAGFELRRQESLDAG